MYARATNQEITILTQNEKKLGVISLSIILTEFQLVISCAI
jgi:hypothetical protein